MAKYKVVSKNACLGHAPGEEFTQELDPDHEARLIARGSLKRLESSASNKPAKTPGKEN